MIFESLNLSKQRRYTYIELSSSCTYFVVAVCFLFAVCQGNSANIDGVACQAANDENSTVKEPVGTSARSEQLERIKALSVIFISALYLYYIYLL